MSLLSIAIMGTGRMGTLIRSFAEAARTTRTAGIGAEELRDRLAHALEEEDR